MSTKKTDYLSDDYWSKLINQSLIRFFILRALKDEDMHGYKLIRAIRKMSNDYVSPAESTLYPALNQMQAGELIQQTNPSAKERKVYRLTDKGKQAFKIAAKNWNMILPALLRKTIL